jgi:hypothetical protein
VDARDLGAIFVGRQFEHLRWDRLLDVRLG